VSPATYSSPLPLGVASEQDTESQLRRSTNTGYLYRVTRALEGLVHSPGGVLAHILEDAGVPPEVHRWIGVTLSPICPDVRDPVGVNRGIKSPADPRKPFIYRPEGLGRPVSRILLYPVIHLRCSNVLTRPYTGLLEEPRLPARRGVSRNAPTGHFGLLAPVVYLAGPSRDTAGGLLPHPFTHHLCRVETQHVASLQAIGWSALCCT
jgi:hypothetical protein